MKIVPLMLLYFFLLLEKYIQALNLTHLKICAKLLFCYNLWQYDVTAKCDDNDMLAQIVKVWKKNPLAPSMLLKILHFYLKRKTDVNAQWNCIAVAFRCYRLMKIYKFQNSINCSWLQHLLTLTWKMSAVTESFFFFQTWTDKPFA